MQNLMDGQHQHQLAMLHHQQLFQNHGLQQQAATSESHARGQRQEEFFTMEGEELQQEGLALRRPRKKRYQRHTLHQIQELESYVYFRPPLIISPVVCLLCTRSMHDDDGLILYFVLQGLQAVPSS
jgi:hypothetical protein